MTFWESLFGEKKQKSAGELKEEAVKFLRDTSQMAEQNPKEAYKRFKNKYRNFTSLFEQGKELYDDFLGLIFRLETIENKKDTPPAPQTLKCINWPDEVDMGSLASIAEEIDDVIILVQSDRERERPNPLFKAQALYELASDENIKMVIVEEMTILVKKDFLVEASREIPHQNEEIIQDLIDFAQRKRYVVRQVF